MRPSYQRMRKRLLPPSPNVKRILPSRSINFALLQETNFYLCNQAHKNQIKSFSCKVHTGKIRNSNFGRRKTPPRKNPVAKLGRNSEKPEITNHKPMQTFLAPRSNLAATSPLIRHLESSIHYSQFVTPKPSLPKSLENKIQKQSLRLTNHKSPVANHKLQPTVPQITKHRPLVSLPSN